MELKNGYKVIYEARERQEPKQKRGPFFATKTLPALNDSMLISYDNNGQYVDLSTMKLLYSDGKHLLGSTSGFPAENDVNIIFKNALGEIIFGEVKAPVNVEPVKAAKKKVVEEPVVEEEAPVVEEPAIEEDIENLDAE